MQSKTHVMYVKTKIETTPIRLDKVEFFIIPVSKKPQATKKMK